MLSLKPKLLILLLLPFGWTSHADDDDLDDFHSHTNGLQESFPRNAISQFQLHYLAMLNIASPPNQIKKPANSNSHSPARNHAWSRRRLATSQ